jgi:hypothetical protein
MGTNARNTVGLKLIQLASDTYAIQHQCLLAPMKTVKIGEPMLIIYPDTVDPSIYPAKLLELWQEGDVLYLKLWNYKKDKWELHAQDLTTEDCLFSFVSMPFITKLAEIMTCRCNPESPVVTNPNISEQDQSRTISDRLKNKPDLPQPFYNSYGKKVLEFISSSEIMLDLPFILTQKKRLRLNMPYLKTESSLSGNKVVAVRLLDVKVKEEIIQLFVQELASQKQYDMEWNLCYSGSFWLWSLADFQNATTLLTCTDENYV